MSLRRGNSARACVFVHVYVHTAGRRGHEGMVLTQEEIDGCRDAFLAFDKDRSGNIDVWELRQVSDSLQSEFTSFQRQT